MSDVHRQPFWLRLWLVLLMVAWLGVSQAQAAPAPSVEELLSRPSWAQGHAMVSRQEFSLLLDKVVRTRQVRQSEPLPEIVGGPWISRGQAVDLMVRAFGFHERLSQVDGSQRGFSDLEPTHPFRQAVLLAGQTKLINGYPDGSFRPDQPLSWLEAETLLRTLRGWTLAMPEQVPPWVAEKQERANAWHRLFDTARLGLTLAYGALATFYLIRAYRQPIKNRTRRLVTNCLMVLTVLLMISWVNELGFVQGFMQRTLYQVAAFLSVVAAFVLLKTGQVLSVRAPEPGRQPKRQNLELGYVEAINHAKGELYVVDPVTKRKVMVTVTADTKVYNRQGQNTQIGYLSEIQIGDVVNVNGRMQQRGSLMTASSLIVVAKSRPTAGPSVYQLRPLYLEAQANQVRVARTGRR